MKKILITFLTILSILSIGACSGSNHELDETKAAALTTLSSVDLTVYRANEEAIVIGIIDDAKKAINQQTTEALVAQVLYKALADINKIKTASQLAEEEAAQNDWQTFINTKKEQLENLVDLTNYYQTQIDLINGYVLTAKVAIDTATSINEVNLHFLTAKVAIEAVLTKQQLDGELGDSIIEQIDNAKILIEGFVNLNLYRTEQKSEITQIIIATKELLDNASDLNQINTILDDAKSQIKLIKTDAQLSLIEESEDLELFLDAQEAKISVLRALLDSDDYYPEEQELVNQLVLSGINDLEDAVTIDSLNTIYDTCLAQIANIQTKAQLGGEDQPVGPEINDDTDIVISGNINVIAVKGYQEGLYVTWQKESDADFYNVYYKDSSVSSYKLVDDMLIRQYPNYYRVDIVGLKKGDYDVKIVGTKNNVEIEKTALLDNVTTSSYIREGYAFVNGTSSGAYNEDGTLRDNAIVIYVTDQNKDSVTASINTGKKEEVASGLSNIISLIKKGSETRGVVFRFIGNVTTPSSTDKGDIVLETNSTNYGITIEGIGDDTYINGWGIRLKNSSNVEIRNIGFMLTDSGEKDNVGLQQGNDHIWVHNNDFFYGKAGGDADQAKGDGALDTKKSLYVTHSYNHFFDTGKSHLTGNKEDTSLLNYITYFGNWYDHSDSRHPRVRKATVHVYNNLFDGVSKYGVGATLGANIFVENNVFKNTKNPILSSKQGTDAMGDGTFSGEAGGMVKAYGNISLGTTSPIISYQDNNSSFDAYLAKSRNEVVPSNVKTLVGGSIYNNFDTKSDFYKYQVISAEFVEAFVKANSGRVDGGDFTWQFSDADNTDHDVNMPLMNKLIAYKSTIVSIGNPKK